MVQEKGKTKKKNLYGCLFIWGPEVKGSKFLEIVKELVKLLPKII